jgi:hypothetical protein
MGVRTIANAGRNAHLNAPKAMKSYDRSIGGSNLGRTAATGVRALTSAAGRCKRDSPGAARRAFFVCGSFDDGRRAVRAHAVLATRQRIAEIARETGDAARARREGTGIRSSERRTHADPLGVH